jgi:hypothetical protein
VGFGFFGVAGGIETLMGGVTHRCFEWVEMNLESLAAI